MTVVRFTTGESWDVIDADCEFRPCLRPGFDKGSFTPGVGYTRYYDKARPVCMKRHVDGCPHKLPEEGVEKIYADGSVLLALLDPLPCCASPDVPRPRKGRPLPWTQRCRSCGATLRGKRLEMARVTWNGSDA